MKKLGIRRFWEIEASAVSGVLLGLDTIHVFFFHRIERILTGGWILLAHSSQTRKLRYT